MRLRNRRLALAALLLLALAGTAQALSFRTASEPNGDLVVVFAQGRIERGAASDFREILRRNPGREVALVISSGGGLLRESVEISGIVSRFRIPVLVPQGATCASACFLVLAASPNKTVDPAARVGVPGVSVDGEEGLDTLGVTALMGCLADEYRVPPAIIGRMIVTPPGAMVWLAPDELRAMRVRVAELPPITARASAALALQEEPTPRRAPPSAPAEPLRREAPAAKPPRLRPSAVGEAPPEQVADGLWDRTAWEAWLRTLSPSALAGAIFWAGQRSLPAPQGCGSMDAAFWQACDEARLRLVSTDRRHLSEPDYRAAMRGRVAQAAERPLALAERIARAVVPPEQAERESPAFVKGLRLRIAFGDVGGGGARRLLEDDV